MTNQLFVQFNVNNVPHEYKAKHNNKINISDNFEVIVDVVVQRYKDNDDIDRIIAEEEDYYLRLEY